MIVSVKNQNNFSLFSARRLKYWVSFRCSWCTWR